MSAAAPIVLKSRSRQFTVLAAVCLALTGVVASMAALNVALQPIAFDLGATQSQLLWIVNAYTIVLAGLLLPLGAVGDRWGRKPILVAGLVLFIAASLAASQAQSIDWLIAMRIITGLSGAMIMPATLSTITSTFPDESRGMAIGVWTGFAGAGGILGLLASAAIVDNANWRWVFAVAIIPTLIGLLMTVLIVPNTGESSDHPYDIGGAVLSFLAIGGIVMGIQEGPERGWDAALTVAALAIGVLALIGFILYERRHPEPLLDTTVFASPPLAAGSISLTMSFAVLFGIFLVLIQFLVAVVGFSTLKATMGLAPIAMLLLILSPIAPILANRLGLIWVLTGGILIVSLGTALLALRADEQSYSALVPGLISIAIGMGLSMTPATTAITASLPSEQQGVASALNDTVREVGGAIGVAVLGSILNAGYSSAIAATVDQLPGPIGEVVDSGITGALVISTMLPTEQGEPILAAAQVAFVDGWINAMWVGSALLIVTAVVIAGMLYARRLSPEQVRAPRGTTQMR